MATTNQLVSRIKRRLTRPDSTGGDPAIIDELAAAQERLENGRTIPKFLQTTLPVNVPGAHAMIFFTLITGFIRMDEEYGLRIVDPLGGGTEGLTKIRKYDEFEQLIQKFPGLATISTDVPRGYHQRGDGLLLRPTPIVTKDYSIGYYRRDPTAPTAGNSTLWTVNLPDLLAGEAGMAIGLALRDKPAMDFFAAMRAKAHDDMIAALGAAEDADQDRTMGD